MSQKERGEHKESKGRNNSTSCTGKGIVKGVKEKSSTCPTMKGAEAL